MIKSKRERDEILNTITAALCAPSPEAAKANQPTSRMSANTETRDRIETTLTAAFRAGAGIGALGMVEALLGNTATGADPLYTGEVSEDLTRWLRDAEISLRADLAAPELKAPSANRP